MPELLGDLQYNAGVNIKPLEQQLTDLDAKMERYRRRWERTINIGVSGGPSGGGSGGGRTGEDPFWRTRSGAANLESEGSYAVMLANKRLAAAIDRRAARIDQMDVGGGDTLGREIGSIERANRRASDGPSNDSDGLTEITSGRSGRGGLRLGRLSQAATIYEGIRVAETIGQSLSMVNNPLLNTSSAQTMQTQSAAIEKLTSTVIGQFVGAAVGGLDLLSQGSGANMDPSRAARGFGILGQYSPYAMQAAQYEAGVGLEGEQAGDRRLAQSNRNRSELTQYNIGTQEIGTRDPFKKRYIENFAADTAARDAYNDKQTDLQAQLATAVTDKDFAKQKDISSQIQELNSELPDQQKAWDARRRAADKDVDIDWGIFSNSRQNATFAKTDELAGNYLQSKLESIDAQFKVQRDANGNISLINGNAPDSDIGKLDAADIAIAQQQAKAQDAQRIQDYLGESSAIGLQLGYDPLGAQKQRIEDERRDALAPGGTKLTNADEIDRINKRFDLLSRQATQNFGNQTTLIDIGQSTKAAQIAAGMNRDPIGAQTAGIVGSGTAEADQLSWGGRPNEAKASLQNSIDSLNLLKFNYLDAFRGTQVDLRLMDTQNPRDSQDPTKILGEISTGVTNLLTALNNLTSN